MLEDTPAIAAALPCRIAVYREAGRTKIATILPTALLSLFPNPELQPVAEEVERTRESILKAGLNPGKKGLVSGDYGSGMDEDTAQTAEVI